MKKNNLLILAVAALGFAACTNDETTAVNEKLAESNAISFRTFVGGQMRAADVTTSNLNSFKAYAIVNGSSNVYFAEDDFTKNGSTFKSTTNHYWPASGALDFYAYAPATSTQYTHGTANSLSFVVTPSTTISEQVDLVVANTNNKTKTGTYGAGDSKKYGADGIPLNFRHAESKVVVRFKNGQANMKIDVLAFKIVNVDGEATYTYTAASNTSTDGNNSKTLTDQWTDNTTYTATYTGTLGATNQLAPSTTTAVYLQNNGTATTTVNEDLSMILIPQTTTAVAAYTGSAVGNGLEANKSYIAVKMIIRNNDSLDDGTEVPSTNTKGTIIADCTGDGDWAIWPVAFTWIPGKKYIYTIDLADGGYWEKEHVAGDTDLDPVLDGAIIKFVDVTVDDWSDENILGNVVKGGTYTFNEAADAADTYYIYVSGLTSGSTLGATLTTAGNLSNLSIVDNDGSTLATTPSSGVARIKVTLAANSTPSSVPATITFTESGTATSTTVININQAGVPTP